MAQSLEQAASKGTANTALGIGIGALGLELLRGGFGNIFGRGLLGGRGEEGRGEYRGGCGERGYDHYGCDCNQIHRLPAAWEVEFKEQRDVLALTCKDYDLAIAGMKARFEDREEQTCENTRLQKEIDGLRCHISVIEATRPYQDKIIQMEIANARKDAHCELMWQTRNMITGQTVLPDTPTVTGIPSIAQTGCGC